MVTEWNSFLDSHPYEVRLDVDDDGQSTLWVEVVREMPRPIALLFGEWLYNLRAALDNVIYDMAILDSGANPPPGVDRLQFPIYDSPASWARNKDRLAPLTDEHRARLEELQPYNAPAGPRANPLYWLNDLARRDRHRTLHIVGAYVAESAATVYAPKATAILFEDVNVHVFVQDRAVVGRFVVRPFFPGDKVEANPNTGLDMEVAEFTGYDGPLARALLLGIG